MRLLNSCSGEMRAFMSYSDVPPYAILSHTWDDDEVSFQDWQALPWTTIQKKKGFQKIEYCCQQAAKDGLEWVWVDTCCIDQTSSAELTESINSMFRWYRDAAICYAYLADVAKNLRLSTIEKKLRKSRWFTRGWTLQELIAPSEVVFYSMDWHRVGTKSELAACISDITHIDQVYLNAANVQLASIAQRMSWAANRETSRDEDVAYCLLGIFDVNMPLIYGEGTKAFQRLQGEIMKAYPEDHTLFAWGTVVSQFSRTVESDAHALGFEPLTWKPDEDDSLLGFLARSPAAFRDSGQFVVYKKAKKVFRRWDFLLTAPEQVGRSIRIDLPVLPSGLRLAECHVGEQLPVARLRRVKTAVLVCGRQDEATFKFVTVPLLFCTGAFYGRTREIVVNDAVAQPCVNYELLGKWQNRLLIESQPRYRPSVGDIVLRRFVTLVPCSLSLTVDTIDVAIDDGYIRALGPTHGRVTCLWFEFSESAGLGLNIARVGDSKDGTGNLHFAFMPVDITPAAYHKYIQDVGMGGHQGEAEEVGEEAEETGEKAKTDIIDIDEGETNEEEANGKEANGEKASRRSNRRATRRSARIRKRAGIVTTKEADKGEEEDEKDPRRLPWFGNTLEACYHLWDNWEVGPYSREDGQYSRVMALPRDTWEVPEDEFVPNVRIAAERMYLDDDVDQPVDVVDIIITTKHGQNGILRT
ncbi:heterokaryon incompatibility protein-domain-containing protein [Hypoxylon cercidicola]|nr:heterokaryon incompatibility protein-domain-containing protein [Hypoxylon cercidicola]